MEKFGGRGTICLLFSLVFTVSKKPRPFKKGLRTKKETLFKSRI